MTTSTEIEKSARGWRFWAPRIATSIFIPVLLLGIAEGALRLLGVGFQTDLTVPCTVQGHAASCYNLFFPAPFFPPGMIKTPQAYAIPAVKPQGTYRIFVLGNPRRWAIPIRPTDLAAILEVMLRERFPSPKFEVINTGSVAINSHVYCRSRKAWRTSIRIYLSFTPATTKSLGLWAGTTLTHPA